MSQEITGSINIEAAKEKPKYDDWEIKDAVRTIIRAEEIKQDAELMKFVAPELQKQIKAVSNAASVLYGKGKENNDEG